jgi:hypothetical protein
MLLTIAGAAAGTLLVVGAAPPPVTAGAAQPWDRVLTQLPGWEGATFQLNGQPFQLLDDGPPMNGARPSDPANFPSIIDIQEGVVVRFDGDLSGIIPQTPCGGGPSVPGVAFGCPPSPLDPAGFADGAYLFGTHLAEPLPPGGLPAQTGIATLVSQPEGTPFIGPWPFTGATGALRFVPGGPVEHYAIGPDGFSFIGPSELPMFVAGAEGDEWIWFFVPPDIGSSFDGVQFHAFLDGSPVSDTIPGNPGDATTLAPFDPAAVGTVAPEAVTPPVEEPVEEPADDPSDAPVEEPAEEEAAPPAAVTTDDSGDSTTTIAAALLAAGIASIVGGTVLLRSRKGPCEALAEAMAAAEDECAKATEAARVAREEANRARQAELDARAAYEPSGFPNSASSIDIDGESFVGRDMQLLDWDRRVHAPSASAAPGGQTAADIARRASEARERLVDLRSADAQRMAEIDGLKRAADEADARAAQAERHRDEVCARAREAAAEYRRRCPGSGQATTGGNGASVVAAPNGSGPATVAVPAGWTALLAREDAVQADIATSMQALGEELAKAFAGFGNIATDFATPYRRAVAGTTVLDELAAEANVDIARAKTADLVLAFVQITNLAVRGIVGGVRLGIRAYQWFTKVPEVVDEAVAVAKAADAPVAVRPVLSDPLLPKPPQPLNLMNFADRSDWVIARLAEQLGMTVRQALDSVPPGLSKEAVITLLKNDVIAKRGLVVLSDATQLVLDRILLNARAASRGQLSALSRADLRAFYQAVDQGLLEKLPKVVDSLDVYVNELGSIRALYDATDAALLRLVAESPELRRLAFEGTTTLGEAGDAVRLGNGPTVFGFVDDVAPMVDTSTTYAPQFGTRFLDVFGNVPPGATVGDLHGVTGVVRTVFGDSTVGVVGTVPPQVAVVPPGVDPFVGSFRPVDQVLRAEDGEWRLVLRDDQFTEQGTLGAWRLEITDVDPAGTEPSLDQWRIDVVGEVAPWLPAPENGTIVIVRPGGIGLTGWPVTVFPPPDGVPVIDLGLPAPPFRGFESGVITLPTPEQIRFAEQMLDNARGLATGDGSIDGTAGLDDLGALGNGRAGGWDRLADAVISTPNTYVLPFGLVDVGLLQAAVASGGDAAVLAETMGPVPANLLAGAVQAGPVLRSMADLGEIDVEGLAAQRGEFQALYDSLSAGGFPDYQGYVKQFLRDEVRGHNFNLFGFDLQAGSGPAEFGWIFVKYLSEPITTFTQFSYEQMADDLLQEYWNVHNDDFVAMIETLNRAMGFLAGFGDAIGEHLDALDGQATALQGVLDDLRAMEHDADREAHVARKLADLGRSMDSLRQLRTLLGNIAGWLESLVAMPNDDSGKVTVGRAMGLLNPTSILRMMSSVLTLGDAIGKVLLVAPPPRELVLSPENEAIYEAQKAANEAALRERERVESMSDAEREQYEAEERAANDAELARIGEEFDSR